MKHLLIVSTFLFLLPQMTVAGWFSSACKKVTEVFPTEDCGVWGIDHIHKALCQNVDLKTLRGSKVWDIISDASVIDKDENRVRALELSDNSFLAGFGGREMWSLNIKDDKLEFRNAESEGDFECIRSKD